jgi:nucleoside-diphosphate-sugar epimerase
LCNVIEIINDILETKVIPTYVNCPIKNYVKDTLADISLARSELGYEPKWSIVYGIKKLVNKTNPNPREERNEMMMM